ncbi:hypothetical protein SAMN05428967_0440 [Phyllobacterium sp. YR620]|nr:hypothetical protein SAMN05428967_0440 [Phyllobacterium sp. YR620]
MPQFSLEQSWWLRKRGRAEHGVVMLTIAPATNPVLGVSSK